MDAVGFIAFGGDLTVGEDVDIAADPALPARLAGSPLRDEAGFARKFERALRTMWHRHCATQRVSEPA